MSEIKSKEIKLIDINGVIPNPKNTNRHSIEQIERLSRLIKFNGFRDPLIISRRSGFLIAGHGRLEAAKLLGMKEIPVVYQDFKDEAEEFQFLTAHNEIARWAELDFQAVYDELEKFDDDFDVDLLGIENFKLPDVEIEEPKADEDEVPEVSYPITKRGDVWILGNHRLMCGDSTFLGDVEDLMNNQRADITFTSPPYNIGKSIRGNMYKNNEDDKSQDDYLVFLKDWTSLAMVYSDYVFHNNQLLLNNREALIDYQYEMKSYLKDILIWNKSQWPPHINKGTFGSKWEYIFCLSNKDNSKQFPCSWQGKYPNVIETENNSGNEFAKEHKAGFPVAFPLWLIEKMDFAKSVYEPFCGTGTTMIACEKTDKKCYGMELDEHYCDVIINRWQNYTSKEAVLESTGQTYEQVKQVADK